MIEFNENDLKAINQEIEVLRIEKKNIIKSIFMSICEDLEALSKHKEFVQVILEVSPTSFTDDDFCKFFLFFNKELIASYLEVNYKNISAKSFDKNTDVNDFLKDIKSFFPKEDLKNIKNLLTRVIHKSNILNADVDRNQISYFIKEFGRNFEFENGVLIKNQINDDFLNEFKTIKNLSVLNNTIDRPQTGISKKLKV